MNTEDLRAQCETVLAVYRTQYETMLAAQSEHLRKETIANSEARVRELEELFRTSIEDAITRSSERIARYGRQNMPSSMAEILIASAIKERDQTVKTLTEMFESSIRELRHIAVHP